MADEKDRKDILVDGKPIDELNLEEVAEAVDKGEVELPEIVEPNPEDLFTLERLEKFILGDLTFAQLQGMTMDEAYNIAEYGYSLFQEGRYHDSRTVFEALVYSNPYDAYFHTMLGAVYQQLDMKDEAAEEYTTAIELDVEHLHAYVNRGELLLQNGEFERALDDLRTAIELDPEGKDEAGMRARALAMATARALEEVQKLIEKMEKEKKD